MREQHKRDQIEGFIGRSIGDDQWAAMVEWWDSIAGLSLPQQQKLWKSAYTSTKYAQQEALEKLLKQFEDDRDRIPRPEKMDPADVHYYAGRDHAYTGVVNTIRAALDKRP